MKPILFSTKMVQSILAGEKTQTRRVIKDAKSDWEFLSLDDNATLSYVDKDGEEIPKDVDGLWATFECDGLPEFPMIKARNMVGDILYVRETWVKNENPNSDNCGGYEYRADYDGAMCQDLIKWRPSIFMPKEAARLFLLVKNVRVERLQDITQEDALSEGMTQSIRSQLGYAVEESVESFNLYQSVDTFRKLWDSLNDKRGYGWMENPWIWVYEFEVISKEQALAA